jgi:hypothetical protein
MKNTGSAIGGVLNKLGKTMDTAGGQSPATGTNPATANTTASPIMVNVAQLRTIPEIPPARKGIPFDLAIAKPGMSVDDLIGKFGDPEYKVAASSGETWYYKTVNGYLIAVTTDGEKIRTVVPPKSYKPPSPSPVDPAK